MKHPVQSKKRAAELAAQASHPVRKLAGNQPVITGKTESKRVMSSVTSENLKNMPHQPGDDLWY